MAAALQARTQDSLGEVVEASTTGFVALESEACTRVADIAAGTAFLEVAVGSVSQAQGFIQFSNGQETGV